jgi:hypothetical protein
MMFAESSGHHAQNLLASGYQTAVGGDDVGL